MNNILARDFDLWRNSIVGEWFFGETIDAHIEHYRAQLAQGIEEENPLEILTMAIRQKRLLGIIDGLEFLRNLDPFEEDRSNETESNRQTSAD